MLGAAAIDLLLQIDELATLGIEAGIAWAHTSHARGGIAVAACTRCASSTVYLLPYLTTTLNPQQARIGKIVVLEPLVVFRQIGIPRATLFNAVAPGLPGSNNSQGQESCTDADATLPQEAPQPNPLPAGEGGHGCRSTPR